MAKKLPLQFVVFLYAFYCVIMSSRLYFKKKFIAIVFCLEKNGV